jgi:hypothetical protein
MPHREPCRLHASRVGRIRETSGEDDLAASLALDLGIDVRAKEPREAPVMVLAEHDHIGVNPSRGLDDHLARFSRRPGQLCREPGSLQPVARLV